MSQIIKTVHQLSEDERVLLKALIEGPAFGILKKIAQKEIDILQELMITAEERDVMIRLQGRIVGIKSFVLVPQAIVAGHNQQEAAKQPKKPVQKKA